LLKPAGHADGVALIDAHPAPREPRSQECCGARDALQHRMARVLINKPLRRPAERLAVNKQDVAVPEGQPYKAPCGHMSSMERAGRQMDTIHERVHAGVP